MNLKQIPEVWVAGESLMDVISYSDGSCSVTVGGGPANTAKALSKLRIATSFVGGFSLDDYGIQIQKELLSFGVNLELCWSSKLPTARALATLNQDGSAKYDFQLENTASFDFRVENLPAGSPKVLHIGSLGTLLEPGATSLFNWAKKTRSIKIFDPNIRSSVLSDRTRYRSNFESWLSISDVVKLSQEEFFWLYSEESFPLELLEHGPSLVVMTMGVGGIVGAFGSTFIQVPAVRTEVVDTVGAGDSVGAVIAEAIVNLGISGLMDDLERVLIRASKAAAINCSRAGANPPWKEELDLVL
jgi:fructokinase